MRFCTDSIVIKEVATVCTVKVPPNYQKIFKKRPNHGIVLNLRGKRTFTVDNVVYSMEVPSLTYIPINIDYTAHSFDNSECIAINFTTEAESSYPIETIPLKNEKIFLSLFQEAEKEFNSNSVAARAKCLSILYNIIAQIQSISAQNQTNQKPYQKIVDAVQFIEENIFKCSLNITDLAAMCGMSASYFRQNFISIYGVSPKKYINSIRINHAKNLLLSQYYSVTEISEMVGYSDIYAFCKAFKKFTGLTPTEFVTTI